MGQDRGEGSPLLEYPYLPLVVKADIFQAVVVTGIKREWAFKMGFWMELLAKKQNYRWFYGAYAPSFGEHYIENKPSKGYLPSLASDPWSIPLPFPV